MHTRLSRRDFLAVAGLSLGSLLGGDLLSRPPEPARSRPNLIILLFDALSARNVSLYGYPRQTTPNLDAFAGQSIVYHAHHAAANYTTPSTASLFTGVYPWTHGAYHSIPGQESASHNLFQAFGAEYYRLAFAQNLLADMIVDQMDPAIDRHLRLDTFSLTSSPIYATTNRIFAHDSLAATLATQDFLYSTRNRPGSLFFALADRLSAQALHAYYTRRYQPAYPFGLPYSYLNNMLFDQRKVFAGAADLLSDLPSPSLAYLHFWSPHEPYRPHKDFVGRFEANPWQPIEKPQHAIGNLGLSYADLNWRRTRYDEGIAHIDAEFGRLVEKLRLSGRLEDSYVIVTADHGQMFERGLEGHTTPLLYEALLHIPLLVHAPGQRERQDIYANTSNIDLLPTLLHLGGHPIPGWAQGQILPGLGGGGDSLRSLFAIDSKATDPGQPLEQYSVALFKGEHKLIAYNYPGYENQFELYNLAQDPEEMDDLNKKLPDLDLLKEMKEEVLAAVKSDHSPR
jgi:arylsulfatase A-like enzyme